MKKGDFSKIVVIFCVLEMAFMQFWAMKIASHNSLLVTGLLTANHAVFGGELLLLCLKKLLYNDKNILETKKQNNLSAQEEISEEDK